MLEIQHQEIENLEKYLDRADVNLKNLSASAEDAWHELKAAIDELMHNIDSSLKRLLGESNAKDISGKEGTGNGQQGTGKKN